TYPLVDDPRNHAYPHYREIVFEGTAQQALAMLGSENDAAVVLGQRYFFHHPETARALLAPLVEDALLETAAGDYRLQRRGAERRLFFEGQPPLVELRPRRLALPLGRRDHEAARTRGAVRRRRARQRRRAGGRFCALSGGHAPWRAPLRRGADVYRRRLRI